MISILQSLHRQPPGQVTLATWQRKPFWEPDLSPLPLSFSSLVSFSPGLFLFTFSLLPLSLCIFFVFLPYLFSLLSTSSFFSRSFFCPFTLLLLAHPVTRSLRLLSPLLCHLSFLCSSLLSFLFVFRLFRPSSLYFLASRFIPSPVLSSPTSSPVFLSLSPLFLPPSFIRCSLLPSLLRRCDEEFSSRQGNLVS